MYICERCQREFKRKSDLGLHFRVCSSIPDWIIELDDDYKLKQRYFNKRVNALQEGLECELTYEDFCILVRNAGLKSSNLGFTSSDKYVLARINDKGNYILNNCRFITQAENAKEKVVSELSRKASSINIRNYNNSKK